MIVPSLQSFAEQLRGMVTNLSEQDWNDNLGALSEIRKLATKPRGRKSDVPKRSRLESSSSFARSLSELLELPVHGQVTPEEVESGFATLKSERDITDHCSNMGMTSSAVTLVKTVLRSFSHSKDVFKNIWDGSRFYETEGTPERRLLEAHHAISVEGHVNGARYRINALLFACVYYARVQQLGAAAKRETLIMRKLEEESGKSHSQIKDALKRGRWYLAWVNKLGIGAIFALGESFATGIHMQDIDQVVDACKSIEGFHQRSSDLSSIARMAIEQAIAKSHGSRSGSAVQETGMEGRYIEHTGMEEIPLTTDNAIATIDGTRGSQTSVTRSPQQNVTTDTTGAAVTREPISTQPNVDFNALVPAPAGERQNLLDTLAEVAHRQLRNEYATDSCTDGVSIASESDAFKARADSLVRAPKRMLASHQAATTRQEQNKQTPAAPWSMSYGTAAQCVPPSNNGAIFFSEQFDRAGTAVLGLGADSAPDMDDLWSEDWYPPLYDEFYGFG